ncbi:MAG: L-seryl-tRNA(Sec) selenium transferase [Sulfobacillus benefaciens]|uniref:L-seryl-tRNA(Sec) selenium transferase n=1 Tax=Sulfobacillus benefaciens TaxID=453960 RepID=A0A2T2XK14_9FIRM|nr:MAG: L-seryl-tRNA(Sec) selenium transferase [Sulfobacillus benefaciens]
MNNIDSTATAFDSIPAVHKIWQEFSHPWPVPKVWIEWATRDILDNVRQAAKKGTVAPNAGALAKAILERAQDLARPHLRPLLNATGVIIHTNLGRAPLANEILDQVNTVAAGYSTLEYDLERGTRGSRHDHVSQLVEVLTGAEAAMVVNNNAAAVLLALSALAKDREVIVSRGELVEIGGSFRIPEVMALSGAKLREVGATNKTHLRDYSAAISENTGLLLKVHQSNFRVIGFTQAVSTAELVALGHGHRIPVMEDLGSGVVFPFTLDGIEEPSVKGVVSTGIDLVTFSGDKLLGGPQAGLVAGRRELIDAMKRYPLARAVRVDKMTLAALEVVVRWYLEGEAGRLPLWRMIHMSLEELEVRTQSVATRLRSQLPATVSVAIGDESSEIGGGSMPGCRLPTKVLRLKGGARIEEWERQLRRSDVPVVCRVQRGELIFDLRTIFPSQETLLIDTIVEAFGLIPQATITERGFES